MFKRNTYKIYLLSIVLIFCVYMSLTAYAENNCNDSTTPSIPGNYQSACDSSSMSWNDPGSADTIARNSNCKVAISDASGKGGPYVWSVSGNGFSFTNTKTLGLSNTLHANGSACGSATINVKGCGGNGEVVTGYVRCTTGRWTRIQQAGRSQCVSTYCSSGYIVVGKYRYYGQYGAGNGTCTSRKDIQNCTISCPYNLLWFCMDGSNARTQFAAKFPNARCSGSPYNVIGGCQYYTVDEWTC